jgi:hypothetical protein
MSAQTATQTKKKRPESMRLMQTATTQLQIQKTSYQPKTQHSRTYQTQAGSPFRSAHPCYHRIRIGSSIRPERSLE